MEPKTLIAILIVTFFLYQQVDTYVFPEIIPKRFCPPGLEPNPDNPKLCVPEIPEEPSYFQGMKELMFMAMVFVALTYIFTRKKS